MLTENRLQVLVNSLTVLTMYGRIYTQTTNKIIIIYSFISDEPIDIQNGSLRFFEVWENLYAHEFIHSWNDLVPSWYELIPFWNESIPG